MSDATVNLLPIKTFKVYVASDSFVQLRKVRTKGGNQGLEIATMENIKAPGMNDTE